MRRGAIFGLLVFVASLWWLAPAAYKFFYPNYTCKYRITVGVDTPSGERVGSSVVEVDFHTQPPFNGYTYYVRVFGEGVFVDLGDGKNLVALLASGQSGENTDYAWRIVFEAFKSNGLDVNRPELLPGLRGRHSLYPTSSERSADQNLPTFVTFTDPANLATIRLLPPGLFDSILGPGFSLRSVVIEMTSDEVSHQIQSYLPWLPHPNYLNGKVGCGPGDSLYCLQGGHFMRSK